MLTGIQEFAPKPLAVSDAPKPPAPTEEFSVSLDHATLKLLLDDMNKLGIDTSKLKISGEPAPAPRLTPFDPQPAPPASSAPASNAEAVSEAQFVPEFVQNARVYSVYGTSSGLNPAYFATRATAEWMAKKYGTGEVVETPYEGNGGPYLANANEFQIRLRNGKLTNAGTLADYYRRMPEDQFPGVADAMIRSVLISDNGPGIV
ncbi:MAG TPA: hypothetical protein VNH83_31670 [Bryobacteraceae bacterium]|nr:hypothetical protein [Bryobacteraceae bacterium]